MIEETGVIDVETVAVELTQDRTPIPDSEMRPSTRTFRLERAGNISEEKPWHRVSTSDVEHAIHNTPLEPVVKYLQSPTNPPLPLEAVLGKALAMAGSLMAKPRSDYVPDDYSSGEHGVELARFRILTGGRGQVTNIWSMCAGPSGAGKDIGNLDEDLVSRFGNHIGSSGSAAGLYEAYMENGAGLLGISEFEKFLDNRSWESQARTMLTTCFNSGHFDIRLSRRATGRRRSRYCYPSVTANIQPDVFKRFAGNLQVESGFLPRFLISILPRRKWRPASGLSDMTTAVESLKTYDSLTGEVTPEENYLDDLRGMFCEYEAIPGVYGRYVNEYGPRIACILQADGLAIRPETWDRTRILIQWFYSMAETVFGWVKGDGARSQFEKQLNSLHQYILRKTPDGGVSKTIISRNKGEGTTASQRDRLLAELKERGWVIRSTDGCYTAIQGMDASTV